MPDEQSAQQSDPSVMEVKVAPPPPRFRAVLFAAAIGAFTVVVFNGIFSAVTGAPLNLRDELPVFLFQAMVVAAPFLLIALLGIAARAPWLLGITLTAAFWGYYLYDGLSRRGDGSGANIGLGLLFIASPLLISAACLVAAQLQKARLR